MHRHIGLGRKNRDVEEFYLISSLSNIKGKVYRRSYVSMGCKSGDFQFLNRNIGHNNIQILI